MVRKVGAYSGSSQNFWVPFWLGSWSGWKPAADRLVNIDKRQRTIPKRGCEVDAIFLRYTCDMFGSRISNP